MLQGEPKGLLRSLYVKANVQVVVLIAFPAIDAALARSAEGSFGVQVLFCIERGHAAKARGRDGLTVDVVCNVTGGEDTGNACSSGVTFETAVGNEVPAVGVELACEDRGVRAVADGNEHTVYVQRLLAARGCFEPGAGDPGVVTQHLDEVVVPDRLDVVSCEQSVLQNFFCTQRVPAMHQVHLAAEVGQVQRLLDRRVATAYHHNFFAPVEEAITGGAGADAAAFKGLFAGQAEVLGRGAGGDDERVAAVSALIAGQHNGLAAFALGGTELSRVNVVVEHRALEPLDVLRHLHHELGALQRRVATGPILDFRGGGQLAAHFDAGEEYRVEIGTGRIERGRVARRPGAEHDQAVVLLGRGVHGPVRCPKAA